MYRFWCMSLVDDAEATRPAQSSSWGERSSERNNRAGHDDGQVIVEQRLLSHRRRGSDRRRATRHPKVERPTQQRKGHVTKGRVKMHKKARHNNEQEHRLVEHDMSGDGPTPRRDVEASVAREEGYSSNLRYFDLKKSGVGFPI